MAKVPSTYPKILERIKLQIRQSQLRAVMGANAVMLQLYWNIGNVILEQQKISGWGAKVIDRLSTDLQREFPEMKGISERNLKYMRQFAATYPDFELMQATLAQISWYHHITLLTKVKSRKEREFYIAETVRNGWSRNIMVAQIATNSYKRKGGAVTNFPATLPPPQSELASQVLKDPYVFDFLTLSDDYREKDLENALINHITKFLLELGNGFAFVGKQYHLRVEDDDFYIDGLFYHLNLKCYIVIELKTGKFKPEYAGKLNFYLSLVDDKLCRPGDNPSIGLLICQDKNKIVAEYALRDIRKPMGISEYKLTEVIPPKLKNSLPTIQEIEKELRNKE